MATILKFILAIFFLFLVAILWIAYTFYKQIKHTANRFQQRERPQHQADADGDIIIDNRPQAQRKKQIIGDDEGEYVDFTESETQSGQKE